jgi:hypothetical protein
MGRNQTLSESKSIVIGFLFFFPLNMDYQVCPISDTARQYRLIFRQLSRDGVPIVIFRILINKMKGCPKYKSNGSGINYSGSKGNQAIPLKVKLKGCTRSLENLLDLVLPSHLELCALVVFRA